MVEERRSRKESLVKAQSKERWGGAAGGERRGQCSWGLTFLLVWLIFLHLPQWRRGSGETDNKIPLQWRRTKSGPRWLTPPRCPFQLAQRPNSVEIVSSELSWAIFFVCLLVYICGRGTDDHTCRSKRKVDTKTHGGWREKFGAAGIDQTRPDQTHTHQPQEQYCSTDQNAPPAILSVCLSPAFLRISQRACNAPSAAG